MHTTDVVMLAWYHWLDLTRKFLFQRDEICKQRP